MSISVNSSQHLCGFYRKVRAWNFITDFSIYHKIIPQIESINCHNQKTDLMRTEWFVTLDGAPFSWVELDLLQRERFILSSEAVSGDFDMLRGRWKIEDGKNEGIQLSYTLEYRLGIPVIEENVGEVLKEKMQCYVTSVVNNHCDHLQTGIREERRFKRVGLNRRCPLIINGHEFEAHVMNFSRGGMMVGLGKEFPGTDLLPRSQFQIAGIPMCGNGFFDSYYQAHRITFSEPLQEQNFRSLFETWAEGMILTDDIVKVYEVVTTAKNPSSLHQNIRQ